MTHAVDDSVDPAIPWPVVTAPNATEARFDVAGGNVWLAHGPEQLARRTRYLSNEATLKGVLKVAPVADVTALRALTGVQSGDVARVGRYGLYRFEDDGGAGVDRVPWVYRSVPQGGTWYHENEASPLDGQVVEAFGLTALAGNTTIVVAASNTTYKVGHATNTRLTLTQPAGYNFRAGSTMLVDLVARIRVSGGTAGGGTRLTITEGSTVTVVPGSERVVTAPSTSIALIQQRLAVQMVGGTSSVNLDLEIRVLPAAALSALDVFKPLMLRGVILRP